jgi:predicted phosphate transport protein (TIGR00153 family)
MWLSDLFKSSQSNRYFDLLVRQATILSEAARTLLRYYETGDSTLADEVDRLELLGDETLKSLVEAIRDSFITPLDRQDLYYLGETIDDMTDYLESAAVEFKLFDLAATPAMREMCAVLVTGAAEIEAAVCAIATDPSKAYVHARAASATEDHVEDLYRKALADLFSGDDFRTMLKTREIYRHLSNSADRADDVARVIAKIVVKTT